MWGGGGGGVGEHRRSLPGTPLIAHPRLQTTLFTYKPPLGAQSWGRTLPAERVGPSHHLRKPDPHLGPTPLPQP